MTKWYAAFVVVTAVAGAFCKSIRGSICWSVFIVGDGGPGGVRLPWENVEDVSDKVQARRRRVIRVTVFMCLLKNSEKFTVDDKEK